MRRILFLAIIMAFAAVLVPLVATNYNVETVTEPVEPLYVGFSAMPKEGCAPLTVEFTDQTGNATSWLWRFGDGDTSIVQNPTHTFIDGGIYSVKLVAIIDENPDSNSVLIHVEGAECDTVRIDTLFVGKPLPAQITVPVYIFADDTLGGFSLGFVFSDRLTISAGNVNADAFPPGESALVYVTLYQPEDRKVAVGGLDFSSIVSPWGNWDPAERIVDFVFDLDPNTPDTVITLDSMFILPATKWSFTGAGSTPTIRINPQYVQGVIVIGGNAVIDLDRPVLPEEYTLEQNVPNPFNPNTYIDFALPRSADVTLEVFNVLGQKVRTLVDQHLTAGHKRVDWNGTDDNGDRVSSGIYLYRLTANDFTMSKKMVLMK